MNFNNISWVAPCVGAFFLVSVTMITGVDHGMRGWLDRGVRTEVLGGSGS